MMSEDFTCGCGKLISTHSLHEIEACLVTALAQEESDWVKYRAWIDDYLATLEHPSHCRGKCKEVSHKMQETFPELRIEKGFVTTIYGDREEHWWCETPSGDIVDPTEAQFGYVLEYEPYVQGMEVRLGRCMNCGDEIYGASVADVYSTSMCSQECGDELTREYNIPTSGKIYDYDDCY